jgi:hypothetical protein
MLASIVSAAVRRWSGDEGIGSKALSEICAKFDIRKHVRKQRSPSDVLECASAGSNALERLVAKSFRIFGEQKGATFIAFE